MSFRQLEDGTLGIAVGDVSGKGIAAALLMATLWGHRCVVRLWPGFTIFRL